MTAHCPIPPAAAVAMLDHCDINAQSLIADLAEAGLIKAYARLLNISDGDAPSEVRDSRIPRHIWRKIIERGKVDDVFSKGSVRLSYYEGNNLVSTTVIGIRFDDKSISAAAIQHGHSINATASKPPAQTFVASIGTSKFPESVVESMRKQSPLEKGALQLTITETMAALGIGRTFLYTLVKEGLLELKKTGGRSHITAESIRSYMTR